jgi:HEAT repeat protein
MYELAALVLLIAVLASAYILLVVRRRPPQPACGGVLTSPGEFNVDWTKDAGDDLGALNESARCDLIFAAGELDSERSHRLLINALADPSATVSLAAAHALARSGRIQDVQNYAASAEERRSKELLKLLSLIH